MLVRGISVFTGHFPNEINLYYDLINRNVDHIETIVWAYLGGMLAGAIIGIIFQIKMKKSEKEDEFDRRTTYFRMIDKFNQRTTDFHRKRKR